MKDTKAMIIRIPKEYWVFLKEEALRKETSATQVVNKAIEIYKNQRINYLKKREDKI